MKGDEGVGVQKMQNNNLRTKTTKEYFEKKDIS